MRKTEKNVPATAPPAEVSEEYLKAVNLTKKIVAATQVVQQGLYEMCTGLKEMRDGKLYKELGYSNFEDYCEQAVGIKRRQAYTYINVLEKLPEDFVQSTAQIGVQKLALLASISEEERAEITENTDLESTTVRELEAQIKTLKEKAEARESYYESRSKADEGTIETLKKAKYELQERIYRLEKEIKELESRPIEVAVQEDNRPPDWVALSAYNDMIETYTGQLAQKDDEFTRAMRKAYAEKKAVEEQLNEVQKQLEAAGSAEPEKVTVPDTDGVFKAHFANAYTALNTLVLFAQEHTDYIPKVNGLINNVKKSMEVV